MKFGLISNYYKDPQGRMLARVCDFFTARGCELVIDRQSVDPEQFEQAISTDFSDIDIMISMGGDGTFLNAVHAMNRRQVPIVGINLGSVGFLTEIRPNEVEEGLNRLLCDDFVIEERMLLDVSCVDAEGYVKYSELALNEALLSRGASQRIIPVQLYFDQRYIENIRCDGILVATPTGSTGYAMAAGGPIVHPDLELVTITPICPYSLHNRSYLLNPSTEVSLKLDHYPADATLSVDGRNEVAFKRGDQVNVRRAQEKLQRICLNDSNFFEGLPDKLRGRADMSQTNPKQE